MEKDFGGVIWTNHAIDRLRQRDIKQGDAWATWKRPDNSEFKRNKGIWVYQRVVGNQRIEVVAKKSERGQWIILSAWSKRIFDNKALKVKKSLVQLVKDFFLFKK